MPKSTVARFYDQLAPDYERIYADWDASMRRQGAVLDELIRSRLGPAPVSLLDCACGIGTQAIPLALAGHRVTGTDISAGALTRAAREAACRGARLPLAAADMRQLPFGDARFDVVLCADNALPHLLSEEDLRQALHSMRRVLRAGGLLLASTRPYDEILRSRPVATPPTPVSTAGGRSISFQLWHWHEDGEHYDLELFQLALEGEDWRVKVRRTTYWALPRQYLTDLATEAGFTHVEWQQPESSGFFQPLLCARAG